MGPLGAPFGPWGPSMGGKALCWRFEQWAGQTFRVTGKKGFRVTGKWASGFRAPGAPARQGTLEPLGPFWPRGPQYGREGALLALGAMGKKTFRATGKKELRVTGKWASGFRVPGPPARQGTLGPLGPLLPPGAPVWAGKRSVGAWPRVEM